MALKDNLVGYWKLDESSGNAADSVGSNTLTNNNTTTYAAGKINNGAVFNGSNQLLNSASLSLVANTWTISVWANPNNANISNQTPFSYRPATGNINVIQLEGLSPMKTRCVIYSSNGTSYKDYRTSLTLTQSAWNHLVVTWDETNLKIYINGTEDTSITKSKNDAVTQTLTARVLRVGAETAASNFWDGNVDEVGIWSRALTAGEVSQLYNSGNGLSYEGFGGNFGEYLGAGSGITKGLWHLNGNSNDSSGNGHNLTNTNSVAYVNNLLGQCADFGATNSNKVLEISDTLDIDGGNITMSAIFILSTLPSNGEFQTIIRQSNNSSKTDYSIRVYNDGGTYKMVYIRGKSGVGEEGYSYTFSPSTGVKYSASLTYDGTNIKSYFNGSLVNSTTASGNGSETVANLVTIGAWRNSALAYFYPFKGLIDEVIIENVAWSAEKVKKYYTYSRGFYSTI